MALSAADAAHLIRRTGFGVTPALLGQVQAFPSREAAVERVLDVSRAGEDDLAPINAAPYVSDHATLQLLQEWWLDRMVTTPVPLQEKLTLFWHSHFVSSPDKVYDYNLLLRQNQLLRAYALGSFADLVQKVSVDPAMLMYLDNHLNVASAPQENFGRELLEVFTLGPAGRTEADVVAMTRAWTGYGLDRGVSAAVYGTGTNAEYHPADHDNGLKALFELAPRNWAGPEALDELLFRSRSDRMSRFVTAKLFSFLAYPVTPDDAVVVRLAEGFRRSRLHLAALVRSILLSEEFWSPAARGALVRSPAEWVVAALQATHFNAVSTEPEQEMPQMGQKLFHPPNVAGWGQNGYWLATARTWAKASFARRLSGVAHGTGLFADVVRLSPADVATRGFQQFGIVTPSAATRRVVEDWVRRSREAGEGDLVPRNLVVLMLLSPDFQLA